jgi:glucosylglycerate synthase
VEELSTIPQAAPQNSEQMDSADVVVGILAELDQDNLAIVCDSFRALPGAPRIAVLQYNNAGDIAPPISQSGDSGASVFFVPASPARSDTPRAPAVGMSSAYQSVFTEGERLGAKGCCVIASKLEVERPQWACQLVRPVIEEEFDLVVSHYAHRKFEGLINSSIISPLMRCLYGKRIRYPVGPDLGVSRRLYQKMLAPGRNAGHPLLSLTPTALCNGLQVCEVYVGARIYAPTDWTNISSLLAQVLSPIFLDMERNAACWQRVRGSVAVPGKDDAKGISRDGGAIDKAAIDVNHMVQSFQLGNRDLQEIWSAVLPPSTLFELKKLSRLPVEQFHMSDDVWVRLVYDFALAHRLRTINRDHLLKSMTPLYLAWVASYARDLEASSTALEQRLENLSFAYEAGKPYLVSRWRWPDRFNP